MERNITFGDLTQPENVYALKKYLREIYALLDPRFIAVNFSASLEFDADQGDVFLVTLTDNVTSIKIINPYYGRKVTIIFAQDNAGGHTLAGLNSDIKLAGGTWTPDVTAGICNVIEFVYTGSAWVETSRSTAVQ